MAGSRFDAGGVTIDRTGVRRCHAPGNVVGGDQQQPHLYSGPGLGPPLERGDGPSRTSDKQGFGQLARVVVPTLSSRSDARGNNLAGDPANAARGATMAARLRELRPMWPSDADPKGPDTGED